MIQTKLSADDRKIVAKMCKDIAFHTSALCSDISEIRKLERRYDHGDAPLEVEIIDQRAILEEVVNNLDEVCQAFIGKRRHQANLDKLFNLKE